MGSKGPFVTTIQLKLANAAEGYAYMFMTSLKDKSKQPMDGIFGRTTASVVLEYQKDNNIKPADGRVRKNTWDRLKNISVTNNYNPQTQKWEPISGEKVQSKST
jgi:peptidoglycan hydrolase-like protein with peptidoglycan-binding domain